MRGKQKQYMLIKKQKLKHLEVVTYQFSLSCPCLMRLHILGRVATSVWVSEWWQRGQSHGKSATGMGSFEPLPFPMQIIQKAPWPLFSTGSWSWESAALTRKWRQLESHLPSDLHPCRLHPARVNSDSVRRLICTTKRPESTCSRTRKLSGYKHQS